MLELSCCFDVEEDIAKAVRAQRDPAVRKGKLTEGGVRCVCVGGGEDGVV